MTDAPDGARLLALARHALSEEIAGAVPRDLRYTLLMIANAMAIAERELEQAETGERPPPMAPGLAGEIRAGHLDADAETHQALLEDAVARLRQSNPKAISE